jgi:excinuclease UvrABC nuclease subunit
MEFDYLDETDERIIVCAPRALSYPARVTDAPSTPGIYLFLDDADEVIYVGSTHHGKLVCEISSRWNTGNDIGALRYRWFRTGTDDAAHQIESDWIDKYQPRNNSSCELPVGITGKPHRPGSALSI